PDTHPLLHPPPPSSLHLTPLPPTSPSPTAPTTLSLHDALPIFLNLVREHQPISRADIARRMTLGRGMVTTMVNELLQEGALVEGALAELPRGRRPKMLHVNTRQLGQGALVEGDRKSTRLNSSHR